MRRNPPTTRRLLGTAIWLFFLASIADAQEGTVVWSRLSSAAGDLPPPTNVSGQQTASLIFDIDKDGFNDFVISERLGTPSLVWYRNLPSGWQVYTIDSTPLAIEAGGHFYDVDGDGDEDVIEGGDSQSNEIWWWENPYPNFDPATAWTRRLIKQGGLQQHHDLQFADFDGDGRGELIYWNGQPNSRLFFAEIPTDPRTSGPWPATQIFQGSASFEGMDVADVDGDGIVDLVAGGRWFQHAGGGTFIEHVIDPAMNFTRAAVGQLVPGGYPEIVFVIGDSKPDLGIDGKGPIRWYEWDGTSWLAHDLLPFDTDHGHSLDIVDFNNDGHLDIFNAEMNLRGNTDAAVRIFYGNGDGTFELQEFGHGIDNHESKVGDLDGDGDFDILGKPFSVGVPGVNIWINERVNPGVLPLDRWQRFSVDPAQPWLAAWALPGDLDGNGRTDIVSGGWWYPSPLTYDGVWTRSPIGAPFNNVALVHDFDSDGDLDLLGTDGQSQSPTHPGSYRLYWARNDGFGNFTVLDNIEPGNGTDPSSAFIQGIVPLRLQPTGPLQLAISWNFGEFGNSGIDLLTVPSNPSQDTWQLETIHPFSEGEELVPADLDGDGDLDLFQGSGWLRNNGSSWERITVTTLIGNNTPYDDPDRVSLADVDADGDLDAVVGLLFEQQSIPVDLVWLEHPDDPTQEWPLHVIGNNVWGGFSLSVQDMDNDGDPDVVLGEHVGLTRLLIFENDGTGHGWTQHIIDSGGQGIDHHDGALAVDFDDDGDFDIVSLGWHNQKVWFYENQSVEAPVDTLPPTAPRSLQGSAFSSSRVDLTWQPSLDNVRVAGYEIFRDGTFAGTAPVAAFFSDRGASPDTTHEYTIVAVDTSGNRSEPSVSLAVSTPTAELEPPTVPDAFAFELVSPVVFDLSWTASTDNRAVIGYFIYLDGVQIASVQGTTHYRVTGLTPGSTHTVEIAAFDAEGNVSDASATLQTVQLDPIVTGLWGAWGFEEQDQQVLDTSGNHNDGVIENGALRTGAGRFGAGLELLGSAGNVDLGPLDVFSAEMTIMMWFNADDFGVRDARLISKSTSSAEQDHVWMLSTINGPSLRFRLKTADGITKTLIGSGGTFGAGAWIHAAATYDGTTMRLYQNGVEVGNTVKSGPIALAPTVKVWIGGNPGEHGQVFDGRIDDVKIFGRALTAAEIQSEMLVPAPPLSDSVPPTTPQGLQGAPTSSSTVDLSWTASTDNALVAGYRIFQNGVELATTQTVTYTVTGLSAQTSYQFAVLAFDAAGNESPLTDSIAVQTDPLDTEPPSVPQNLVASATSPTRVELAWDASTDNIGITGYRLFRDQVEIATLPPTATGYADTGLTAGTAYNYQLAAFDAEGNGSDPSLATAVATTPSVTSALWGAWGFEEADGPTVADTSGNGNHGVLGAPATRTGLGFFGQALETNGLAGHVDLGTLDVSTTSELTIMAWLNADDFGVVDGRILSKSTGQGEQDHVLMLSTITGPRLRFRLKTANGITSTLIGSGGLLTAGTWVHAAATYDGSTMRLYQDGVLVGSVAKSGAIALDPTMRVWIANNPGAPNQVFDGRIDEVKIFGRALTGPEIQAEMLTAVPPAFDPEPPTAPQDFEGVAISQVAIRLSWTAATDNVTVAGYRIFQNGALLTTTSQLTHTVSGLTAQTSYEFAVQAFDAAGNASPVAGPIAVQTEAPDTEPPSVPGNFSANATSATSAHLSWSASTDNVAVAGYRVLRDGSVIATTTQATYVATGLTAATNYEFAVLAFDEAGNESLWAGPVTVVTDSLDTEPPSAPQSFAANVASATRVDLSWSPSTDNVAVMGYRVLRDHQQIASLGAGASSYSDTGLVPNTTYGYELVAFDAQGNESNPSSASLIVTTPVLVTELWGAWGFEEASGPDVVDGSGNANHGVLGAAGTRSALGYFGQALEMNGQSGFVDLGGLDVPTTSGLTIMAWFNADDFGVVDARLVSKSSSSAEQDHVWMLSTIGGPSLRFRLKTADGRTTTLIGKARTFPAGVWVHAAATYDGTRMRLYQDGVEVGSVAKTGPIALNPAMAVWIGNNPGDPAQVFDGRIDEVKIYGRALTQAEIAAEMFAPIQ